MKLVKMIHPNLPGTVAEVPESAVPHHAGAGWELLSTDQPASNSGDESSPPASEDKPPRRRPALEKEND